MTAFLQAESSGSVARRSRVILHVDLDAFFVSVEQARRPELKGLPVIVGGDPNGRGVVATASYEARVFGVYSGMPLRTAKRLAAKAVFLRGDFAEYSRVSKRFHGMLDDYTPLVESGGLDEAYLDMTGCEAIAGPPQQAAATLRRRIRDELGLAASVGIGSSKLIAKMATEHAKPDGIFEVPEGGERAFLAPLQLREMPFLGASTEKRLRQIGVTTLGQLAALPVESLTAMLGSFGQALWLRSQGIDDSPLVCEWEQKSFSREGTFASDVAEPVHLRAVLRGFSESVGSQLRAAQRRARTVTLKLRYADFSTISRSITVPRPASSDDAIFEAVLGLLDAQLQRDNRPVRLVGVGASNLGDEAVQLPLEASTEQRGERLSVAVDRVRRRYGARSLQTGRTAFDPTARSDRVLDRNTGLSSQLD